MDHEVDDRPTLFALVYHPRLALGQGKLMGPRGDAPGNFAKEACFHQFLEARKRRREPLGNHHL